MSLAAWLDHDFPYEPIATPPGLMHAGTVLDVPVFALDLLALDDLGAEPLPASDGATGDSGPIRGGAQPSGSGSSALAVERTRNEMLGQLIETIIGRPSQWHSFLVRYLRKAGVERIEQLPLEYLHTVVEQSYTVAAARGQHRPGATP